MKGGSVVSWGALAVLERLGVLPALPLPVPSVDGEEVGSPEAGSQRVLPAVKNALWAPARAVALLPLPP